MVYMHTEWSTEQLPAVAFEQVWWAHSASRGWVVLDRRLPCNRTTTLPEQMRFTRCADGTAYEQGESDWDYEEAESYLEKLPYEEAIEAESVWMQLVEQYAAA